MKVLRAAHPSARKGAPPFDGAVGDLVLPWQGKARFAFQAVDSGASCGDVAMVAEAPDLSPVELARRTLHLEAGELPTEILTAVAHGILHELAWLVEVPAGSRVSIGPSGRMHCHPNAEADWFRQDAKEWALRQRREGYLPLLAKVGARWRVTAIRWSGSLAVVDVAEAFAALRTHKGFGRVEYIEAL